MVSKQEIKKLGFLRVVAADTQWRPAHHLQPDDPAQTAGRSERSRGRYRAGVTPAHYG